MRETTTAQTLVVWAVFRYCIPNKSLYPLHVVIAKSVPTVVFFYTMFSIEWFL